MLFRPMAGSGVAQAQECFAFPKQMRMGSGYAEGMNLTPYEAVGSIELQCRASTMSLCAAEFHRSRDRHLASDAAAAAVHAVALSGLAHERGRNHALTLNTGDHQCTNGRRMMRT